jgi:RNA polymerase sigma-70 factor (ECF subfamily)
MSSTDQELVRRWMERQDAEAFREIASRYSGMVYATCERILGNATEAEDVAQECFEILAQKGRKAGIYLGAWLHKVATNRALKHIRAEKRRKDRETRFVAERESTSEVQWDDIYAYVDEAVAGLPEKLRVPVVLHFFENETHDAIADTIGTSRTTVTYRIRKGVEEVRKSLKRCGVVAPAVVLTSLLAEHLAAEAAPATLTVALGKLALAGATGAIGGTALTSAPGIAALGGVLIMKKVILGAVVVSCTLAGFLVVRQRISMEPPPSAVAPPIRDFAKIEQVVRSATPKPVPERVEVSAQLAGTIATPEGILVTGSTVDSSGQPVPGAKVTAYWRRGSWREGRPVKGGHATNVSESDGAFQFAVPASDSPEKVGFNAEAEGLVCVSEDYDLPEEGLRDVMLTLAKTDASIEGTVIDTAGNPLGNAQVTAKRMPRMGPGGLAGPGWGRTITGPDGAFILAELMPGRYQMYVKPSTYRHYSNWCLEEENQVTLEEGEQKQGVTLVFGAGLTVSGMVTDPAGEPVTGADIEARADIPTRKGSLAEPHTFVGMTAKAQEDGSYVIEGFPEGEYALGMAVSAKGYVRAYREEIAVGSQQDFVLDPAPSIEGRVVHADTGAPITRFAVEAWPTPEDRASEDEWYRLMRFDNVVQDEEGRFAVDCEMGSGNITVAVKARGFELTRVHLSGVAPGDAVRNVIVRLEGGGIVKGIVTDSSGEPIVGARVLPGYPPPLIAEGGAGDSDKRGTLSDEAGTFEIVGVSPETEVISAYHRDYAPGWTKVNVSRGGTTSVHVVLGKGGTLEGVVSLDGQPLGAREANMVARFPDGKSGQLSSDTQSDGKYRIDGLAPGPTVIHCYLNIQDAAALGCPHWLETEVDVVDGQTTTVDFYVVSGYGATAEGTIFFEGIPVASAQVWAWFEGDDGTRAYFSTTTDERGGYMLVGLPVGVLEGRIMGRAPDGSALERTFTLMTRSGQVTQQDLEIAR